MRRNLSISLVAAALLLLECNKNTIGTSKTAPPPSSTTGPAGTPLKLSAAINTGSLVSIATGMIGEISGKSTINGALVDLNAISSTNYQRWGISDSAGFFRITNTGSGKLLQSYNYGPARVPIQNAPDNQADQLWQITSTGQNSYKIINKGSGLALTTPPGAAGILTLEAYTGAP